MQRFFITAFFCSLALSMMCTLPVLAQHAVNSGTEFWLCFDQNYRNVEKMKADTHNPWSGQVDTAFLALSIVSENDGDVVVDIPSLNFHTIRSAQKGKVLCIDIPSSATIVKVGNNEKAGIHVSSSQTMSIVAMNHLFQTTDSYGAIPVSQLGRDYVLAGFQKLSQDLRSQASVIATQDFTELNIELHGDNHLEGQSTQFIHVTLNSGDVYHLGIDFAASGSGDISGTRVTATKPVAVFSGHSCAYVPSGVQAGNMLVEQLHPVDTWGTQFITQNLPGRTRYSLKIIAAKDNTKIEYVFGDGIVRETLASGQVLDLPNMRGSLRIRSTQAVQVMQFSHGFKDIDSVGDPCMITLRPLENYAYSFTIVPALISENRSQLASSNWKHYALICVPTSALSSLQLNGKGVDASSFIRVDNEFSVGSILMDDFHTGGQLRCQRPISMIQYGYGTGNDSFDAYGHGW